ncbi:FadR/GntR family transcriptional regulator [Cellulosimicrobium arenosum]|uniref:FadR family transcriptional regulator n=1 Tax=Cellulosimicrobium arenosum TaxID=2708133 RepID=A0A927G800_9MICO|nr:FCD domain-containing protein [Cellulosimicrobium arenosum]MBD8078244.1 FadR family transcriptional regulator [Cellulosimicrobium arenosum]
MSQPITPPRKVSELVVERLTERVEQGQWPVGSRIPSEPELVAELGVGRNTVREAVRALEHAGILEPRRGDGTYVRASSGLDAALGRRARTARALDVLEVRGVLERGAARLAAARDDAGALARLRAALDDQVRARSGTGPGSDAAFERADVAFHSEVVRAAGNPLLAELYDGLDHALVRSTAAGDARRHDREVPGHEEVVDAVAAGDPDGAERAVARTIATVRAQLLGATEAGTPGPSGR